MQVFLSNTNNFKRESHWSIMAEMMDYGHKVIEFELQSRYYVHFRTNTLGKVMNPLISPRYGFNSTTVLQ